MPVPRVGFVIALIAVTATATTGGQAPSRTGLIVGQVVDAVTGEPVPDAIVTLTTPFASSNLPTTPRGRVMTDGDGRFFFAGLPSTPAGSGYAINASKPGYVDSYYGKRRPGGSLVYFDLADGERRNDAKVLMWKYAAIAGTVVDEAGEPIVGVSVRALSRQFVNARGRTLGVPVGSGQPVTTDDRGMYRISTLVPGDYVVVVPSSQATFPASVLASAFQGTGEPSSLFNEMSVVSAELTPLGMPRSQQVGDLVVMTLNRTALPPAPGGVVGSTVYQTVFHPAALSGANATAISLVSGEERTGVDFQLRPVPAVRVSGKLIGPNGPVPLKALRLIPASANAYQTESGFETATALTESGGAFTFLGVPAGEYVLRVNSRSTRPQSGMLPTAVDTSVVWAAQSVAVGDTDVRELLVAAQPLIPVAGSIQLEGSGPRPKTLEGLQCRLAPVGGGLATVTAQVDSTGSFIVGVPAGTYSLRPDPPNGWYVKSVSLANADFSDGPIEIRGTDTPAIVVTYSTVTGQVAGTARSPQGAGDPNAAVLLFPVDKSLWSGLGTLQRLRASRASRTGAYTINGLPPGEYYIAAVDDAVVENWQESKSLEALARIATRVTVAVGDRKAADLKVQR